MKRRLLWAFFFFSFTLFLLGTSFILHYRVLSFCPFLATLFTQKNLKRSALIAWGIGFLQDLFSSQLPLGTFSLVFLIATFIIYSQKWLLFHDKIFSLPIFTFMYSILISFFLWILLAVQAEFSLNLKNFFREFILMSIIDALYAFVFFTLPIELLKIIKRGGFPFLLKRRFN